MWCNLQTTHLFREAHLKILMLARDVCVWMGTWNMIRETEMYQ